MKFATIKLSVAVVIGTVLAVMVAAGNSGRAEAKPVLPGAPVPRAATMTVSPTVLALPAEPGRANVSSFHYQPGMLLQGSGDDIYYMTEAGHRRRIQDEPTFQAFGFAAAQVVRVDDDLLEKLPPAEDLTRLVRYPQGNLYWVMDGQRWLVNEWLAVATGPDYAGAPITLLDSWLERSLPVRLNFEPGALLADGEQRYYFDFEALVPVARSIAPQARVIDVPAGVLAVYEQKPALEAVYLTLPAEAPAAEVYRGPDRQYGSLGAIANRVIAEGRSADGRWLQVRYQGQAGWLAAGQVSDPVGPQLLPVAAGPDPYESLAALPQAQPAALAGQR